MAWRRPSDLFREECSSIPGNRCKGPAIWPILDYAEKQGEWWEPSHSVEDRVSRARVERRLRILYSPGE